MDNNDSIILDISASRKSTSNKYFCSHCNTPLVALTQEDMKGGYICTKCIITYQPNQTPVKKANKFDVPGPPTDSHGNVIGDNDIPIVVIDDVNKDVSSTSFKRQKLSPFFKALEKQGFKITSYEERQEKLISRLGELSGVSNGFDDQMYIARLGDAFASTLRVISSYVMTNISGVELHDDAAGDSANERRSYHAMKC